MSSRYSQYCPVARALEVVGERWTLLIARELLLGPRRFTDLRSGLPGISTNVLTSRMKGLETRGLVRRRTLDAPAASVVYELTEAAGGLATVLATMADWGMHLLGPPRPEDEIRNAWLVLALTVTARRDETPTTDSMCELRIMDETPAARIFHVVRRGGRLQPREGPATDPDAVITMATGTLVAIASGELDPTDETAADRITTAGDAGDARRFLQALTPA